VFGIARIDIKESKDGDSTGEMISGRRIDGRRRGADKFDGVIVRESGVLGRAKSSGQLLGLAGP